MTPGGTGNAFDDLVRAVLAGGQPQPTSLLISRMRPYGTARASAERGLNDPAVASRVLGLAWVLADLGYGADPVFTCALGTALLRAWPGEIRGRAFASEYEEGVPYLTVVRTTAQSCMRLGRFDRCVHIVDDLVDLKKFRHLGEHYVAAYLWKVEALAHQLRITEAVAALQHLSPQELATTNYFDVVWRYIEPFIVDVLAQDRIFNYADKVREVVDGPLAELRRTIAAWTQAWEKERSEQLGWARPKLNRLRTDVDQLIAVSAQPGLADADRVDRLNRGLLAVRAMAQELVLAGAPEPEFNMQTADARINFAATVAGLVNPAREEIRRGLEAAEEAANWCAATGCKRGLLGALQAERALYVRADDRSNARAASLRLHHELRSLRDESSMPQVRAAISRVYRRLSYGMCRAAGEYDAPAEALSSTEFRRGLSVAEPRRPPDWNEPDPLIAPLPAALLGPHTHYLGLSAFDEDDEIAATLYCADGFIAFEWIPLTPSQFRQAARRTNPSEWSASAPILGKPKTDPRPEFAPLLDALRHAMSSGRIAPGDHVCVAVDDPIHAIPLHYLPLHGKPAVHSLSFSRVASLCDAQLIVESPAVRPRSALAAFIPAVPERNVELKARAFGSVCDRLKRAGIAVTSIRGEEADRNGLITALEAHSLAYIHSHGTFDEGADAIDRSGLLVSDGGRAPFRGATNPTLLTPRDVLERCASLAGATIALSACVSGLGRRGAGGDTIGLEFALRARGASTVIASHWDLTWRSAATFFESFFERWLVLEETRAHAWRHAILDQASFSGGDGVDTSLLEACAFSLFGDWR